MSQNLKCLFLVVIFSAIQISITAQAFTANLHPYQKKADSNSFKLINTSYKLALCTYTYDAKSGEEDLKIKQVSTNTNYTINIISHTNSKLKFLIRDNEAPSNQKLNNNTLKSKVQWRGEVIGQGSLTIKQTHDLDKIEKQEKYSIFGGWIGVLEYSYNDKQKVNQDDPFNDFEKVYFSRVGYIGR